MHIRCSCGKEFDLPESHLGKPLVCQGCQATLRVVVAAGHAGLAAPDACLVIQAGPHRLGEQVFLAGELPIQIGKLPGSDLRLQGKKVSRTHCRLVRSGTGWRVEDEASTNGLFVNGQRVKAHELHHGDRIRVGEYRLAYVSPVEGRIEAGPVVAVTQFTAPKQQPLGPAKVPLKPTAKQPPTPSPPQLPAPKRAAEPPPKSSPPRPPVPTPTRKAPPGPPAPAEGGPAIADEAPAPGDEGYAIGEAVQTPTDEDYAIAEAAETPDDEWLELAKGGQRIAPAADATALGDDEDDGEPGLSTARHSRLDADELVRVGRAAAAGDVRRAGFWTSVGKTLVFFIDPNNLAMLVVLWVLHAVLPLLAFGLCLALLAQGIVYGWLCSYWLKVIVEAAAGEDRLPGLSLTEGWLDDIIFPFLKFVVAAVVAGAPAIIAGLVVMLNTSATLSEMTQNLATPVIVMIAVSMFLWPMVMLVVAIGGAGALARIDLIFLTILRTIVPYSAVCLLVAGAWVARSMAAPLAASVTGGVAAGFGVTTVLAALLEAYLGIISMRFVGLYYYHFKKRFAWEWE